MRNGFSVEIFAKNLSRLKLSHLFASFSTSSTKNSLNSLSFACSNPKNIFTKNRVSQFLYFYTHIWCAHMRWWCCVAAIRDAKEQEKGDNFELELSPRLVISPSNLLRSLLFFVNTFSTEITSNGRRNAMLENHSNGSFWLT